jgi:hypothetical protein
MSPEASFATGESSMLDAIPADAFSGADVDTSATDDGVGFDILDGEAEPSLEEPAELEAAEEPAEEAAAEEESAAEEPAQQEAAQEELPEGVRRGKDRNGKEGVWVEKARWENAIHPSHKAMREFEQMAGEPLTADAFDVRNRAYLGQERLYSDLVSGEPQAQAKLIGHFLDEIAQARTEGAVAGNPAIPLAQTFMQAIQQREPEAYAAIEKTASSNIIEKLYRAAADSGDKNLFLSLGHVANSLGLKYKTEAEMQAFFASKGQQNPLEAKDAEIQRLQQQLNGRQANNQAAQLDTWRQQTGQSVRDGVLENAIKPAVAHIQDQGYWKTHPEAFSHHVLDRLHSEVTGVIKKDTGFLDRIAILNNNAARATSAQKRAEYTQQIRDAYVSRAALATEALKKTVLKDATDWALTQSNSRHARQQAGQQQRGPKGTGAAVPKSLIPSRPASGKGQYFDPSEQARIAASLLGA